MEQDNQSDNQIFINAMHQLKKLDQKKTITNKDLSEKLNNTPIEDKAYNFKIDNFIRTVEPEEIINQHHDGVNLKNLTTTSIAHTIDLHNLNLIQSGNIVHQTIDHCYNNQNRYLKIITGKGETATLKTAVIEWLTTNSKILGFKSAPNSDGGAGCLYVLIKKRRNT
jgi:DNA-nicking Smr family endonuclease